MIDEPQYIERSEMKKDWLLPLGRSQKRQSLIGDSHV